MLVTVMLSQLVINTVLIDNHNPFQISACVLALYCTKLEIGIPSLRIRVW
ncbi:hypothetical protein Ahy_A08g039109 isoform F [Arachis hypogaea]|uniref:Uncharacterized protein n=1 Tax=Arachis hypogaea TaxID=3818 RepID=A0A445BVQ8_ARAHY|nr:hypothetical protein Ahy_A08g039109 isoform F [Arachis hypogaea]